MWLSRSSKSVFVYQISSKSDDFRWDMAISRFLRWRISGTVNIRGSIMGCLKSPCGTTYRSSIETIALNCLILRKLRFCWLQTDRQTNRWTEPMRKGALISWLLKEKTQQTGDFVKLVHHANKQLQMGMENFQCFTDMWRFVTNDTRYGTLN